METIKMIISGGDNPNVKGKVIMNVKLPVIDTYWTDMEDKKIDTAELEEKVKFHITTDKYVADGTEIKLKLYDHDLVTPNDDKFNHQEVLQKVIVKANKAVLELELKKEWEQDVKEEWGKYRTLYWEATYGESTFPLSAELKVTCSSRNLFVESTKELKGFPEIYTTDGAEVKPFLIEQGISATGKLSEASMSKIALAKLEKGYLGGNTGKTYEPTTAQGTQRQVSEKEVYTNAGDKETIVRGKDFTAHGTTTKGLDQEALMKENLKINKVLGVISKAGEIWDVFGQWRDYTMDKMSGKTPTLVLPDGGISSMIAEVEASSMNEQFAQVDANLLNQAKKKGIAAVSEFVNSNTSQHRTQYRLEPFSRIAASQVVQGKITKITELQNNYDRSNNSVYILYKIVTDKDTKRDIYIIESFFINQ